MEHEIDTINLVRSDSTNDTKDASVGSQHSATGYNSRQEIRELNLASHCTPIYHHPLLGATKCLTGYFGIFGPPTTFKYLSI